MTYLETAHLLVTGLPGSGKTTVSSALAGALRRALVGKDDLRDILFDHFDGDRRDSGVRRRAGSAAIAIQYYLMERLAPAVIDCALWTHISEPEIVAVGRPMIQVYWSCQFEVARQRVAARKRWDSPTAVAEFERFRPLIEPLRLPFPLVVVDTTKPLAVSRVLTQLESVPAGT